MRLDVVEQVEVMDCEWSTGYILCSSLYHATFTYRNCEVRDNSGQVSSLIHTVRKPAFCPTQHSHILSGYGSCLEEETISGKIMEEIR